MSQRSIVLVIFGSLLFLIGCVDSEDVEQDGFKEMVNREYNIQTIAPHDWEIYNQGRQMFMRPDHTQVRIQLELTRSENNPIRQAFEQTGTYEGWVQKIVEYNEETNRPLEAIDETEDGILIFDGSRDATLLYAYMIINEEPMEFFLQGKGEYKDINLLKEDGYYHVFLEVITNTKEIPE